MPHRVAELVRLEDQAALVHLEQREQLLLVLLSPPVLGAQLLGRVLEVLRFELAERLVVREVAFYVLQQQVFRQARLELAALRFGSLFEQSLCGGEQALQQRVRLQVDLLRARLLCSTRRC